MNARINDSHAIEQKTATQISIQHKELANRTLWLLGCLVLAMIISNSTPGFADSSNAEASENTTAAQIQELDVFKMRQAAETIFAAGQPEPEQIPQLAEAGIQHVINLRSPGEINWDEALAVSQNGMSYHSLPIAGAKDITFENAAKLNALLNTANDENVLLHCGSSNRVGALIALQSFKDSNDADAAIEKGKAYGLTGLKPIVQKLIQEHSLEQRLP